MGGSNNGNMDNLLDGDPISEAIGHYGAIGIEVTVTITLQIILWTVSQNWVQVILCSIGLILALVGIGLIILGIIQTFRNGVKWYTSNIVTNRNENDSKDLEGWLTPKQHPQH